MVKVLKLHYYTKGASQKKTCILSGEGGGGRGNFKNAMFFYVLSKSYNFKPMIFNAYYIIYVNDLKDIALV